VSARVGLKILAAESYSQAVDEGWSLPDLKELVRESTTANVRRVTRFVQLALIGAGRCSRGWHLGADTAVYLSSCRGDTEVTAGLLDDLIRREELPSPVTFVNSVSNAACFHVASALGLHGRSNFITNRFDPIAAALKSAWVDFRVSEISTALVGSVDACSLPLAQHRHRVQVDGTVPIGEGSHWLLLAGAADPRPALATLVAVRNFASRERLWGWLDAQGPWTGSLLAPGQHLSSADAEQLASRSGIAGRFHYRDSLHHYDSHTGAAIEAFIKERREAAMLHINSDPAGRYSVIHVMR
jgi:hypothetical protein